MGCTESSPERESLARARLKLEEFKDKHGFREPYRGDFDDPTINWRCGKPDYTRANYQFLRGKTQNHDKGMNRNYISYYAMRALCVCVCGGGGRGCMRVCAMDGGALGLG